MQKLYVRRRFSEREVEALKSHGFPTGFSWITNEVAQTIRRIEEKYDANPGS
jgi:hypothetical protein